MKVFLLWPGKSIWAPGCDRIYTTFRTDCRPLGGYSRTSSLNTIFMHEGAPKAHEAYGPCGTLVRRMSRNRLADEGCGLHWHWCGLLHELTHSRSRYCVSSQPQCRSTSERLSGLLQSEGFVRDRAGPWRLRCASTGRLAINRSRRGQVRTSAEAGLGVCGNVVVPLGIHDGPAMTPREATGLQHRVRLPS